MDISNLKSLQGSPNDTCSTELSFFRRLRIPTDYANFPKINPGEFLSNSNQLLQEYFLNSVTNFLDVLDLEYNTKEDFLLSLNDSDINIQNSIILFKNYENLVIIIAVERTLSSNEKMLVSIFSCPKPTRLLEPINNLNDSIYVKGRRSLQLLERTKIQPVFAKISFISSNSNEADLSPFFLPLYDILAKITDVYHDSLVKAVYVSLLEGQMCSTAIERVIDICSSTSVLIDITNYLIIAAVSRISEKNFETGLCNVFKKSFKICSETSNVFFYRKEVDNHKYPLFIMIKFQLKSAEELKISQNLNHSYFSDLRCLAFPTLEPKAYIQISSHFLSNMNNPGIKCLSEPQISDIKGLELDIQNYVNEQILAETLAGDISFTPKILQYAQSLLKHNTPEYYDCKVISRFSAPLSYDLDSPTLLFSFEIFLLDYKDCIIYFQDDICRQIIDGLKFIFQSPCIVLYRTVSQEFYFFCTCDEPFIKVQFFSNSIFGEERVSLLNKILDKIHLSANFSNKQYVLKELQRTHIARKEMIPDDELHEVSYPLACPIQYQKIFHLNPRF